jgi:glycosyltransferase involved in cell wall biosynthesis
VTLAPPDRDALKLWDSPGGGCEPSPVRKQDAARRVLHVIPAVARRYGGPSLAVIRMCKSLQTAGVTPTIVATDADGRGSLPVTHGELIDYEGVPTRFFARQWSESFKYSRPLAVWLKRHVSEFDVVHIHAVFSHSSLAAAAAAQHSGVPCIVRPLGSLSPWALRRRRLLKQLLWRGGVRRMLAAAAAVHCTSASEQQHVARITGRPGVVIPLGVDAPATSVADPAAGGFDRPTADCDPYILTLGRLHPVKGLDLLIPAFLELAGKGYERWRLVLAGDGEPRYVAGLAERFGAHPAWHRVEFAGWVDGERKSQLLRHAALLAMPSHQENFGLAAFEALAHSVPVLVSSCIDVADEIRDADAGWVAELNPVSLRNSLSEALSSSGERAERGANGRRLVVGRYTWPAVAERLSDLYELVTSTRTTA